MIVCVPLGLHRNMDGRRQPHCRGGAKRCLHFTEPIDGLVLVELWLVTCRGEAAERRDERVVPRSLMLVGDIGQNSVVQHDSGSIRRGALYLRSSRHLSAIGIVQT